MKRLYIGNLPFSATTEEVQAEFAKFGTVQDCKLISDRETGKARGFGFVTFTNDEDAVRAINALNGQLFGGRALTVNEAEERRGGGGGGNFNRQAGGQPRTNGGNGGGGNFDSGGAGRKGGGNRDRKERRERGGSSRYED
jgi:RNA recognition motif-containing protein